MISLTEQETGVYFLLRKYRVQKHYRASKEAGVNRYAVYVGKGEQVTEPKPYVEAKADCDQLTAREIVGALLF